MSTITDAAFWRDECQGSASQWSVGEARAALDEHETGSFGSSALLADAFGRDDRIPGCLGARCNGFISKGGIPFSIVKSMAGDQRRAETVAKRVADLWYDWLPEEVLRGFIIDVVLLGVALGRRVWDTTVSPWRMTVEHWPAHGLRWDAQVQAWFTRLDSGVEIEASESNGFFVIGSGRGRSWMRGAVRALGETLIERIYTVRDWRRYNERHGMPILLIKEPAVNQDNPKRNAFYNRTISLASRGILRLPQGPTPGESWDADLLEPSDGAWKTFEASLARTDANIAITLQGQNLSTEVKGGSLAATTGHLSVRQDFLAADAELFATALRVHIVMPWGRAVVEGWTDDLAPWPTWNVTPPADRLVEATTLVTGAQALTAWSGIASGAGLQLDVVEFAKRFGVTLTPAAKPKPEPS